MAGSRVLMPHRIMAIEMRGNKDSANKASQCRDGFDGAQKPVFALLKRVIEEVNHRGGGNGRDKGKAYGARLLVFRSMGKMKEGGQALIAMHLRKERGANDGQGAYGIF